MEAVLERGGKGPGGSRRQGGDQQRRALHIENGVGAAVAGGEHGARFHGRQVESGTTTASPKRFGRSSRTARVTPPESIALATIEPSVQGATLSGWPSRRAASS